MRRKLIVVSILLVVIILVWKPFGSIKSYFNFSETESVQITYITDNFNNKTRFLEEDDMDEIFTELINSNYYFRFSRKNNDIYGALLQGYSFKVVVNNSDIYYVAVEDKFILLTNDSNFYSFRICSISDLHILLEEIINRDL